MSDRQTIENQARAICEPLIAAEGLELLEVEWAKAHEGWVLRLTIDKPGGRVGVDDCSTASHAVDTALDVEDFIAHEYHLEVSSPGLNRPLVKPQHFEKVVGQTVRVKTFAPIAEPPRKNFLGTLKAFRDDVLSVEVEGAGTFEIPLKDVAKATLEPEL